MTTPSNQTSQITPNWNLKSPSTSKNNLEFLILKLLCNVIFLLLTGQSDIFYLEYQIFNQMSTHGNQTSQIMSISN